MSEFNFSFRVLGSSGGTVGSQVLVIYACVKFVSVRWPLDAHRHGNCDLTNMHCASRIDMFTRSR